MLGHGLEALRRRQVLGVVVSVAFHAALVAALLWVHPAAPPKQKRGDALIVELPDLNEPAAQGTPGPTPGAAPVPAEPAPKAPPVAQAPPARPTPPAPSRPPAVARPAPKAEPREAPRAVASAPQPPPVERGDVPVAKAAPESVPEPARPEPPTPPAVASAPPAPPGAVAMTPLAPPDIRSALRRGGGGEGRGAGGAGGPGTGRGGILGESIPLDSKEPDFSDYLERVRRLIKQNWGYPCVKNVETRECEYKSAKLVVDFGILKHGPVQFVEIHRASGWAVYDDYAVNAIKLASPFPPVPPALLARIPQGSTGIPIRVNFTYVLETGITNVLR